MRISYRVTLSRRLALRLAAATAALGLAASWADAAPSPGATVATAARRVAGGTDRVATATARVEAAQAVVDETTFALAKARATLRAAKAQLKDAKAAAKAAAPAAARRRTAPQTEALEAYAACLSEVDATTAREAAERCAGELE